MCSVSIARRCACSWKVTSRPAARATSSAAIALRCSPLTAFAVDMTRSENLRAGAAAAAPPSARMLAAELGSSSSGGLGSLPCLASCAHRLPMAEFFISSSSLSDGAPRVCTRLAALAPASRPAAIIEPAVRGSLGLSSTSPTPAAASSSSCCASSSSSSSSCWRAAASTCCVCAAMPE